MNIQNKQIEYIVFAVLSLLAILLFFLTLFFAKMVFYGKNAENAPSSFTVSATGEVKAVPNIANFSFSAVESGKDVNEAQSKMADIANKAIAYLKSKGIEDKDIQTSNYSANPKYIRNPTTGREVINGYEARETINVKVHEASKAGELLSGVGEFGVSELSGLTFESEDKDVLKQQATEDATNKAKIKAEKLAKIAGFRLGKVISFYEDNNYPGPIPYGSDVMMQKAVSSAPVAPEIQLGENTITSTVSITYEIR